MTFTTILLLQRHYYMSICERVHEITFKDKLQSNYKYHYIFFGLISRK
jgi:hypothetical protein